TTGNGIEIARYASGTWSVDRALDGVRVTCVAATPGSPERLLAGAVGGVLLSRDGGRHWDPCGLADRTVKSLAVSPAQPTRVVAGTKPAGLHMSDDGGLTWQ